MKRLGVVGTFVWDTIHHPDRAGQPPLEQWGGIAYSLSAFAAACPRGWCIDPIIRIGADLLPQAEAFLSRLPAICPGSTLAEAPDPTNRVELQYFDSAERTERLTGGVGPWAAADLLPRVERVDAIFINYISGFELDLPTAELVRRVSNVPTYADLHSLCLGPPGDGPRRPRPLPDSPRWIRTADWIQVNEAEFELIGGRSVVEREGAEGLTLLITRGAGGASWREIGTGRGRLTAEGIVAPEADADDGDPTGCGDVWGAVTFCGILDGLPLPVAMRRANVAAAAKLRHPRMEGLCAAIRSALDAWDRRVGHSLPGRTAS